MGQFHEPSAQEGDAGSEAAVHAVTEIVERLMEVIPSSPSKVSLGDAAAVLAEYAALGPAQRQHLLDVRMHRLYVSVH